MPYQLTLDPSLRTVHLVASGVANLDEARASLQEITTLPGHEPDFRVFVDARQIEYVASFSDLIRLRDDFEAAKEKLKGPIAVVLDDLLRFGVTRGLAGMTDLFGIRLRAFRDVESARAWLALQE